MMNIVLAKLLCKLGDFFYQSDKLRYADILFRWAYYFNSHDFKIVSGYSEITDKLGKHELSDRLIDEAYNIDPNNAGICYNKAVVEDDKKHYLEAIALYEKVLINEPNHCSTLINLGVIYDGVYHESEKAQSYYLEGLKYHPNEMDLHYNYANCLNKLKRYKEAQEHYQIVEQLDDGYYEAFLNHGKLKLEQGEYQQAIPLFKHVLEVNPQGNDSLYFLGVCYDQLNDHEQAKKYYQKAMPLFKVRMASEPNNPDTMHCLAYCYEFLGNNMEAKGYYQQAIPLFETKLDSEPDNIDTIQHLIYCHASLEENKEAEKYYQMALKIEPDNKRLIADYIELLKRLGRENEAQEYQDKLDAL